MTAWSLFTDLGWICVLLLAGAFLRAKVPFIQSIFLPSSLIAGVLGLALGPKMLGVIPFSSEISSYAGVLIAVVFAALPFTSKVASLKGVMKSVGTMWAVSQSAVILQWGVGLLFALGVVGVFFTAVPDGFGLMIATGFMGGHGTAAAVAESFGDQWPEAASLGMTAATVGIIVSVVGGIILIKLESMRGNTVYLTHFKDLPRSLRTGMVEPDKREPIAASPVSSMSIDPLIYHAGVLFAIAGISYMISDWAGSMVDGLNIPTFSVAFLVGYLVFGVMTKSGAMRHFDTRLFERTSSSSTDLLVAFGIASIDPAIVVAYAGPLALLMVFGVVAMIAFYFFVAKRLFVDHQVEQSIFTWGWGTGTVAMGIALLRIVDPGMRSKTLDYYGLAYIPIGFGDIAFVALLPALIMAGMAWPVAIVMTVAGIAILTAARIMRRKNTLPAEEAPATAAVD
ncbi:sodium/glutamate symporter [Zhihengliuella salsuginis]|uniref:Sodium:glutamate symporter n=1 Tax=Zhihengliuella salsuginis TaxID=578222 RepID=A0ABQ3GBC6_9MICC|nr:sodium:glutamate symporter [Zhihengliuella salsuginis]GHC99741.1 sodium:glutamate symporter [Zhihengliuella salsuginis]